MISVKQLDHLVLTVENITKSLVFYHDVLGMKIINFADNRKALKFGNQKINLHQVDNIFSPNAQYATKGSADLCLLIDTPIEEAITHLKHLNINIEQGPVIRHGATGQILSIYIRDPDGNLIELSNLA